MSPLEVRRVAAELGVGENARLKLVSDKTVSGAIHSMDKESLVILYEGKLVPVKYDRVRQIEVKRFPAWAKAAIGVGAVMGLLLALYMEADSHA
jgi:hypothetical protein